MTRKKLLALPAPPVRAALPKPPKEPSGYDGTERLIAYAASLRGISVSEFYSESMGPRTRSNSSIGAGPSSAETAPKRATSAGLYDARLRGIEAEMEISPHGKTTDLLENPPTTPTGFLEGPPRPYRAEWERLTGLWLDAVLEESSEKSGKVRKDRG